MGKYLRPDTQACYDFTPDDTDTKMYISGETYVTLQEILDKAKEKWPDAKPEQIMIDPQHIHTHALGYDRYDPSDYTNYIVLELKS